MGIAAAITHITGRDQVDGAADAVTVDRRQHWLAAVVDGIERGLQTQDGLTQQSGIAAHIFAQLVGQRSQHHQVNTSRKMLARATDHDGAHGIRLIDPLENLDDFAPERRVHRVVLFRAVDLNVGDAVLQLDLECLVFGQFDFECLVVAHTCFP
ncbi:hypothetical protein D3C79_633490 [compost metagenome]